MYNLGRGVHPVLKHLWMTLMIMWIFSHFSCMLAGNSEINFFKSYVSFFPFMHVPASTLLFITCSIVKLWTLDWEKKDLEIGKYWWFDHFVGLKWIWKMDPLHDISQETPWCGRVGHVSLLIFCRVRRNLWVSLQWSHLYKGSDIISIFRVNPSEMFCLFISKKQLS